MVISEGIIQWIDENKERFIKMADEIWEFAEIRFEEVKSAKLQIKALEDERTKISEESDRQRTEAKIKSIKAELESVEEGSKRELELKKELLEAEKSLLNEKVDKNVEANEEISSNLANTGDENKDTLKEDLDSLLDFIDNYLKEVSRKRLESIDENISAVQSRQQELVALINQGNASAGESLARLREEEARLELEKKEEEKKAQRRELIVATLKTFNSNLDETGNAGQSLGNTISQIVSLSAFINALPTFYDGRSGNGTESVGESQFDKVLNTGKDDFIARIHKNERILPSYMNEKLGGVSNQELVSAYLNRDMNTIALSKAMNKDSNANIHISDNSAVVNEIKALKGALSGIQSTHISFDDVENLMVRTIREGNKVTKVKKKLNIRKR